MALTKYPKSLQKSSVVSKTANYTATETDDIILCDSSWGAFTVTLPAAATYNGKVLTIKKVDSTFSTSNAITIDGNASETIDGATTTTLNTQYETLEIISDGSNWHVVQRLIPSVWTSFTPTGAFTTNTTYTGFWRRNRDSIDITYLMSFSGAPNSVSSTVNLVSGLTIDTSKQIASGSSYNHQCFFGLITDTSANDVFLFTLHQASTTSFALYYGDSASTDYKNPITQAAPYTLASGDSIHIRIVSLPITGWNG